MRNLRKVADNLVFEFPKEMRAFLDRHPDRVSDEGKAVFSIVYRMIRQEDITPGEAKIIEAFMDRVGTGYKKQEYPIEYLLMAMCCYTQFNFELACMFAGVSFLLTENMLAFIFLYYTLIKMHARETVGEYLDLVERSVPDVPTNMSFHYHQLARDYFYSGQMEVCDEYVQRWLSMKHFKRSQYISVEMCRMNDANFEQWEINRRHYFTPETGAQADKNYSKWIHDSNKHQVACIVAELIYRYSLKSCLELGCHAGALMAMILNLLSFWKHDIAMVGIEPDPGPFELAREKLPSCELHLGDHRMLGNLKGREFGVFLCSFICMLVMEEVVDSILEFASRSCEYFILVDDFSNMNGTQPVTRRYYILHNWSRLLKKHGFNIVDMIFLEEPNEAANGIVISKKCH